MGEGDTFRNAVIGAAVTVVLSFTGVSPVLGGGVAGYLQRGTRRAGAKVGAVSGALAFLPFLLLVVLFFGFFAVVPMLLVPGGGLGRLGGLELLVVLFVVFPFVVAWNVGLGVLGGYLGTVVREGLED